jgi:hypothetical protein
VSTVTIRKCDRCGHVMPTIKYKLLVYINGNQDFEVDACRPCYIAFTKYMSEGKKT